MNFKYAAQSYLDEYLRIDCSCMQALHSDLNHLDESTCKAAAEIATQYSIARTLPKVDEPYRLSFAIEELQGTPCPSADNLESTVVDFAKRLKKRYEAKGLPLSASSKLLWMKYQHPVVIYDSLAFEWANRQRTSKKALETYEQFVEIWRSKFVECEAEIQDACDALIGFKDYTLAAEMLEDELKAVIDKIWFRERVFDHVIIETFNKV